MKQPAEIKVKSKQVTLDEIHQVVIETTDRLKQQALVHLLKKYNPFLETFAVPKDQSFLQLIEKGIRQKIERLRLEGLTAAAKTANASRSGDRQRTSGETRHVQQNR